MRLETTAITMHNLIAHYENKGHFNYTFHISLIPAFVYVNNPKCGCTTAKASINRWYAAFHGEALEYSSMADIHNRNFNPLFTPNQIGTEAERIILHDPDVFRWTIWREPVSRMASAYASKLSWDSSERQSFNQQAGRPARAALPFTLFVSLIHGDPVLRDLNEHWRLQSRQTAADILPYNYICLQETLDIDLLAVRDRLFPGINLGVFETRQHFPGNQSASGKLLNIMDPDEIAMVHETYKDDFTIYQRVLNNRIFI